MIETLSHRAKSWTRSPLSAYLIFGVLGLFFAFRPILFSGFAWMQADPGDTRFVGYILEHGFQWISGNPLHAHFWNPPFFFPEKNVAAFSETLLGTAPIYWLYRLVSFQPDTSFQLWLISISVLNYTTAFLFLRRFFRFDPVPCAIGAFLFAVGSPRICQIGHEQLFPQFWSVLAIWALLVGLKRPRYLFAAYACLVMQFYSGFYLGWFLAFALYVAVIFCLIHPSYRSSTIRFFSKNFLILSAGCIASLILLAPMAYHYLLASSLLGSRTFYEVQAYSPVIASWLYLGKFSWLYRWQEALGAVKRVYAPHEQRLGIGFITTGILAFSYFRRRRETLYLVFFFTAAALIVLTTKVPHVGNELWFFLGYRTFPAGTSIRVTSRIATLLLIPVMIGVASFFQEHKGKWAFLLMLVVIFEQGQSLQYFMKSTNRELIDGVSAQIPKGCRSFYLVADRFETNNDYAQTTAMWAAMTSGVPTINGYTGGFPRGWNFSALTEYPTEAWAYQHRLSKSDICVIHATVPALTEKIFQ